jgi:hypothetical protein
MLLCLGQALLAQQMEEADVLRRVRTALPVKRNGVLHKVYGSQKDKCAVYDLSDGGFVITATDVRMPALLGYSDRGSFAEASRMPAFRSVLDAYSKTADEGAGETYRMRRADLPAAVSPLITDTWHQNEPYWQQTPVVDGKQCFTGCVAHAMAEVMYYYRYPERGTGSHTYTDTKGCGLTLTANFGEHTYDWDNILDSYTEGAYTQEQVDAVALLLSDCGIAVNMRYTPQESGAYTVYQPIALANYFGYDRGVQMYFRDFFTWREWNDMLMTELAAGRPVLMAGYSAGQGHAYVCDGYDEQGLYHINWGWEGLANGYYNIQYMSPDLKEWFDKDNAEQGLNLLQNIVVGIKPMSEEGQTAEVHSFGMSRIYALDSVAERDGLLNVVTCDVSNIGWNLHEGRVTLALKDDEGIAALLKDYDHAFLLEEIDDTSYTDTLCFTVPADVAEGIYRLVPVFSDNGEWKEVRNSVGTPNYLKAVVDAGSVRLERAVEDKARISVVSIEFPDTLEKWSFPQYTVTLRNDGAEFCGRIYFCLEPVDGNSGRLVFSQQGITLMPGEQTTREFSRTVFDAPLGTYRLALYNDVNLYNDTLEVLGNHPEHIVKVLPYQSTAIDDVENDADACGDVRVFTASGTLVAHLHDASAEETKRIVRNLSVPSGLYIVRRGDKTLKIIK